MLSLSFRLSCSTNLSTRFCNPLSICSFTQSNPQRAIIFLKLVSNNSSGVAGYVTVSSGIIFFPSSSALASHYFWFWLLLFLCQTLSILNVPTSSLVSPKAEAIYVPSSIPSATLITLSKNCKFRYSNNTYSPQ